MKRIILLFIFVFPISLTEFGQELSRCNYKDNKKDKRSEEEFKRLHAQEVDIVISGDAAAWEKFYPDDHIVTNPFNQLLDKKAVLERVKGNIIKYKSYEKKMEYLCVYKDAAVIAGNEISLAANDANRPDAGQMTKRRFTEMWIKWEKQWRKVARHVSTIAAQ
jgi:hypothetical protein